MQNLKNKLLTNYGLGSPTELKITDFLFRDCSGNCDFCFEHDIEFKTAIDIPYSH